MNKNDGEIVNVDDKSYNDELTSKSTAQICDTLIEPLLSTCSVEHLSYCDCQRDLINATFNKIYDDELKEMTVKGQENNNDLIKVRKEYAMRQALKEVESICTRDKIKCSIERQKLEQHLGFFKERYNLSDPRVFVIVEALMHQMLSAHRMQQFSNINGVLSVWYDKNDNRRISLSPIEEMKLRYDEAKISAVAALDKIIEGNKNVNINIEADFTKAIIEAYEESTSR